MARLLVKTNRLVALNITMATHWLEIISTDNEESVLRKIEINNVLERYGTVRSFRLNYGSLLGATLLDIMKLAAYTGKPDLAAKYMYLPDVQENRISLIKQITLPKKTSVLKHETSVSDTKIPLKKWIREDERGKMAALIDKRDKCNVLWEYIIRIPIPRMKALFISTDLKWFKSVSMNRQALFAALDDPFFCEFYDIPVINICGHDPLNDLLDALCEKRYKWPTYRERYVTDVAVVPQDVCSICLSDFHERKVTRSGKLSCGHVFHKKCVKVWLKMANTCPLCKSEIYKD